MPLNCPGNNGWNREVLHILFHTIKKNLKLEPSAVALAYTPITGEIEAGES